MGETVITLTGEGVKQFQELDITISVTAKINVDPQTARRAVQGWLVDDVGNMLGAETPELIIGKETVWRVPIVVYSTYKGKLGGVGTIDVDADTGKFTVNDAIIAELTNNARTLARSAKTSAA